MTMREKMRAAIKDALGFQGEHLMHSLTQIKESNVRYAAPKDMTAAIIDAVLDALMEPTKDMLATTIPALTEPDTFDLDASPDDIPIAATLAWKAMITAAKEGK